MLHIRAQKHSHNASSVMHPVMQQVNTFLFITLLQWKDILKRLHRPTVKWKKHTEKNAHIEGAISGMGLSAILFCT